MYILPNATDFNNACASASRTVATKCEVWVGGSLSATMLGDGINGEIISMEWDNIVCSNDGLQIGTCCMDEFKMTYRPVSTTISLMGKEIHPYVGLEFGTPATVTYVPLGVFYVTDVSSEDEDRTFNVTAYDGMQFLMGNFDANVIGVTFPINAWSLLSAIASHFGFTLTYSEELYRLLSSDDYVLTTSDSKTLLVHKDIDANKSVSVGLPLEGTYRDYVGWIAGLVGAYAHMGRNGDLVIARYTDYGFTIARDVQHMGGVKINYGGSVTYTSIISGTDENPVYPTNYGGNAITYSNPFIDVAELDLICDELVGQNGITVTPCDATWRSNPCIDAGDIVGIEDKDGNVSSTYVMERVVNITGGLSETLNCYGETEVQKTLNKSPLVTKLALTSKTALDVSTLINTGEGVMRMRANEDGTNSGYDIYDADGHGLLRCTSTGLGFSPDGGVTYTNAITKDGIVATQLNVQKNGVQVLSSYYNATNDQVIAFRAKDSYYNNTTIIGWSRRNYNDSLATYRGNSYLQLYDAKSNTSAVSLETGYFDDNNLAPPSSSVILWDVVNKKMKICLNSHGTASVRNGTITLYNYNGVTNHEVFSIYSSGESTPYMTIFDADNGVLRKLSLKSVTINNTVYYLLAGLQNDYAN